LLAAGISVSQIVVKLFLQNIFLKRGGRPRRPLTAKAVFRRNVTDSRLCQRIGQQLGHVFGVDGRQVFQLVAATGAGGDDDALRGWALTCCKSGAAILRERSYFDSKAPKAPAIPQQPVSSKVAVRPGKRPAGRAM
jgi:hypothetical protein